MEVSRAANPSPQDQPKISTHTVLKTPGTSAIQRAGRFTKPHGVLTLTINANKTLKQRLLGLLSVLTAAY